MKILDTSFKMTKRRFRFRGQKMCITRVKWNTSINNFKNVNLPFLQSIRFNIRRYKSWCIAKSSSCTTTRLSILFTSCITAIKTMLSNIVKQLMRGMVKRIFWSIKNSDEILYKLNSKGFLASSLSTYYFSTLYTTLSHNLINETQTELIGLKCLFLKLIHANTIITNIINWIWIDWTNL